MITGAEHPDLVGAAPPPRRAPMRLRRMDPSDNALPSIVAAAYERPIIKQWTLVGPVYIVGDPEGVKRVFLDNVANYPKTAMERRFFSTVFGDGLLSSDGDTWRAHRRAMAPAFAPSSVASYAAGVADDVVAFQTLWDQAPADAPIDVARDMTRLTLQIISRAMFSADGSALGESMETSLSKAMAATQINLLDFAPGIAQARQKARKARMATVFADLDAVVAGMIADRHDAPDGADLLSRLVAARDAETGLGLTIREIRDQVVTIFVAGHETTAAAMAWIWYLLSQHPAEEAKLHAELDTVLSGAAPTADDLPQLPYTRMVCEEAMRLYPPAPGTSTRQAQAADEICGMKIPKGALVNVAPWVTHRHKAVWARPGRFEPERFAKGASSGRHRFAYLPFGAGPRVCIGAALAQSEMMIILATLAQRYRLRLAPGHRVAIQHQVTMRPKGGLPMTVTRR